MPRRRKPSIDKLLLPLGAAAEGPTYRVESITVHDFNSRRQTLRLAVTVAGKTILLKLDNQQAWRAWSEVLVHLGRH